MWTDYLSKDESRMESNASAEETHVSFPIGLAANFNEGVVELIKERPYSLGYLQLTYASRKPTSSFGRVQKSAGVFVKAESASITAASAATATDMPDDFRASITNAADADAYPISSFTWLTHSRKRFRMVPRSRVILGFLRWILGRRAER